jgi:hypothetical protein
MYCNTLYHPTAVYIYISCIYIYIQYTCTGWDKVKHMERTTALWQHQRKVSRPVATQPKFVRSWTLQFTILMLQNPCKTNTTPEGSAQQLPSRISVFQSSLFCTGLSLRVCYILLLQVPALPTKKSNLPRLYRFCAGCWSYCSIMF